MSRRAGARRRTAAPLGERRAIRSPRLLLRLAQPSDGEDLFVINRDDEVTRLLPYASWRSAEDVLGTAVIREIRASEPGFAVPLRELLHASNAPHGSFS